MRVEVAGGEVTACRWRVDADAVTGFGRRVSFGVGMEFDRGFGGAVPLEDVWISPVAEATLLVNDDIAQPVQEAASLG